MPDRDLDSAAAIQVEAPAGAPIVWDAALWHQGGGNRSTDPRWSVISYYLRPWLRGKTDSARMLPRKAVEAMSDEAKKLVGVLPLPPDYSEVKALDPDQIAKLTLDQKKVLGFAVY